MFYKQDRFTFCKVTQPFRVLTFGSCRYSFYTIQNKYSDLYLSYSIEALHPIVIATDDDEYRYVSIVNERLILTIFFDIFFFSFVFSKMNYMRLVYCVCVYGKMFIILRKKLGIHFDNLETWERGGKFGEEY